MFLRRYRKVSILGVWKRRAGDVISEFWDGHEKEKPGGYKLRKTIPGHQRIGFYCWRMGSINFGP
jgi:hypothetical protein